MTFQPTAGRNPGPAAGVPVGLAGESEPTLIPAAKLAPMKTENARNASAIRGVRCRRRSEAGRGDGPGSARCASRYALRACSVARPLGSGKCADAARRRASRSSDTCVLQFVAQGGQGSTQPRGCCARRDVQDPRRLFERETQKEVEHDDRPAVVRESLDGCLKLVVGLAELRDFVGEVVTLTRRPLSADEVEGAV